MFDRREGFNRLINACITFNLFIEGNSQLTTDPFETLAQRILPLHGVNYITHYRSVYDKDQLYLCPKRMLPLYNATTIAGSNRQVFALHKLSTKEKTQFRADNLVELFFFFFPRTKALLAI